MKGLEALYKLGELRDLVDGEIGRAEFHECEEEFHVVEKELKAFEKLKQHIEEEYNGLVYAMQRNLDFSDEEDVRYYEKLRAQAYILNKLLKEVSND